MVPTDEQMFISLVSDFGEYYYGDSSKRHLPFVKMSDILFGDKALEYLIDNNLLKMADHRSQYCTWMTRWLNKVTYNLQLTDSLEILAEVRYIFGLYIADIETKSTIMHTKIYEASRRKILKEIASILQGGMGPEFMHYKEVCRLQILGHVVSVLDSILNGTVLELHLGFKYLDKCCVKYVQRAGIELVYQEQCDEVAQAAKELFDKYFV